VQSVSRGTIYYHLNQPTEDEAVWTGADIACSGYLEATDGENIGGVTLTLKLVNGSNQSLDNFNATTNGSGTWGNSTTEFNIDGQWPCGDAYVQIWVGSEHVDIYSGDEQRRIVIGDSSCGH
jgi:hypothetical protein